MSRRRLILTAVIGVVALAGAAAAVVGFRLTSHGTSASRGAIGGGTAPAAAGQTVQLLLSASGHQAVTPELNSLLPQGRLFPAGTTFHATPASWHQAGAYANETGLLREPGKAPSPVELGLMLQHGRWLITFEGQL